MAGEGDPSAPEPIPAALLRAMPSAALFAAVFAGPAEQGADGRTSADLRIVALLAAQVQELGLLSGTDSTTRIWVDVLAAYATVAESPFGITLLDVQAQPRMDGGHQLAGLRAALIVHCRREGTELERRIQRALSTYTNDETGVLTTRREGTDTVYELRDRRLPDWALLSWGWVGDSYVLAIGEDVVPRVASADREPSSGLADDTWFRRAFEVADGPGASVLCFARLDALRNGVAPSLAQKIGRVGAALRLGDVDRGLWAFRYEDRALEAVGFLRRSGVEERVILAGRELLADDRERVVPDEAKSFAVFDGSVRLLYYGLRDAYLASCSPGWAERCRQFWRGIEQRTGVSVDRDVLRRLGHTLVIHDYPAHPLRVPAMWTYMVHLDGRGGALRESITRVLEGLQPECVKETGFRLMQAPDGIWHLQLGLLGPAVGLTDDWLIVSFSPEAVRRNMARLMPVSGREKASMRQ